MSLCASNHGAALLRDASYRDFLVRFGTPEQCFDALHRWCWPDGFRCPSCAGIRAHRLVYRALDQCASCRRQTSVTACSPLRATKIPLLVWFHGLYLVQIGASAPSAAALSRDLRLSYASTRRMRVALLALSNDPHRPLRVV